MPSQNKEVLCTYHYDPLDCLIGLNSAKQDTLQRFYCKSRLATEIQGLMRCSIVQQGDQLLAQQKRLGDTLETALLATDQQRSVMYTVGRFPLPIVYSPYGHLRAESGLTSLLGFNGERPDAMTGHYLLGNGHRAFNPVLMRFNSPDRLSPFDKGGINSYSYCLGDPINMSDPTGRAGTWYSFFTNKVIDLWSKTDFSTGIFKGYVEYRPIQNVSESLKNPLSKASLQYLEWRAAPRDVMKKYKPQPVTDLGDADLINNHARNMRVELGSAESSVANEAILSPRGLEIETFQFSHGIVISELKDLFERSHGNVEAIMPSSIKRVEWRNTDLDAREVVFMRNSIRKR
ncbi:RHS repeat-associated core domain-containing protein [Pseudomonas sp. WJP1]|uniref:RHS repeat-associated core domain-containing protein n=1 Tax=Pseudomonas sp. WJP1 TaxID=2986947 RepID=UPI00234B42FE|nr:RHS repeat-associated core domain-containing protein [Pseudomonas sp. WJP1]WCM51094.1 RHS repeat-associated core domain-containing protein [Pseudomonas sp. WJP1]